MATASKKPTKKETVESLDMAAIIAKKKPVTKRVKIQLDGDIANEIASLEDHLNEARRYDRRHNEADTAPAIEKEMDALLDRAKQTEREFVFVSIGRVKYDELVQQHPPTSDQKKAGGQFNSDTFPPALIAAAAIDPKISIDQAELIFNGGEWNAAELLRMFYAALEANTETADTPLSRNGSGSTSDSLLNLLTQFEAGSPTPST